MRDANQERHEPVIKVIDEENSVRSLMHYIENSIHHKVFQ